MFAFSIPLTWVDVIFPSWLLLVFVVSFGVLGRSTSYPVVDLYVSALAVSPQDRTMTRPRVRERSIDGSFSGGPGPTSCDPPHRGAPDVRLAVGPGHLSRSSVRPLVRAEKPDVTGPV